MRLKLNFIVLFLQNGEHIERLPDISLFQALRYCGRRDSKTHSKSWRGEKEEKEGSFVPFYFRLRSCSIQRARLSRSLKQAIPISITISDALF